MRIGASLVLIALGAILKFAVTAHVSGVNISAIGVILMVIGVVWLILSLTLLTMRRRTDIVRTPNGTTYLEPPDRVEPVERPYVYPTDRPY